eukprot:TRINITY_DN19564_c0_g1_i1.p1 TRINITY_DN19564_c0_g1~~TRINITY_DN19564_c0_g1_i1.p1  ORF type:complete len:427 (-),score=146.80 TRINITY_DN19564_c0_g1_i1:75-1355(-)
MKLESAKFHNVLTPELDTLSSLFTKHGYELRIAGGAVRDLLMDKAPADIDFATTATPDQMKDMFEKEEIRMINNQGEKHGTITARINDKENYEVTTLRIDKVTDGRHAEVEFTTDWQLDANRRDLTINSMFLGLDGLVYDYFNGTEDLKAKKVKFVGDPVQRIQEDYLRILRYFRFYGRISTVSDNHDDDTIAAIKSNVGGMERISGERIWMEWKKILIGNYAKELTIKMIEVGLGPFIGLPSEPNIDEFKKVITLCQANQTQLGPTALLAALLKDQTQVMNLHDRLRLSGLERDLCLFVVANRGDIPHPTPIRPYQFMAVDSKAKVQDTRLFIDQVLKYRGNMDLAKEFSTWEMPRFAVTGNHLKEAGCPPGRIMSLILGKLKETWKESDFEISLEELMKQIPKVLDSIDPKQMAELTKGRKKSR